MTDKELKKLSRLELLELLLEVSKENEKLKEEIEELKIKNQTARNIENLSVAMSQVENALKYANSLTASLETKSSEVDKSSNNTKTAKETTAESEQPSNKDIYRRMLYFFAKNDDKLNVFSSDLENDARARIRSILGKRNTN